MRDFRILLQAFIIFEEISLVVIKLPILDCLALEGDMLGEVLESFMRLPICARMAQASVLMMLPFVLSILL